MVELENSRSLETSRIERTSYGLFFLGQNIIFMLALMFLNLFYTDVLGISAAAVGLLFLIARTWDAINDPILGTIVDRCNFKGGKFLPWLKTVNVLLPLATFALFVNPNLGSTGTLIYAYVTYILWGMIYTLCDVPIFALSTAMTRNQDERVIILTWGRIAALIAGFIVAGTTMPLIEELGWTMVVGILAAVATLVMTPIRFFAAERYRASSKVPSLADSLTHLKNHRPLLIFYSAVFLTAAANTALVAGTYFAIYNLGGTQWVAPLMVAQMLPGLVLAFFIPLLIRHLGKKTIFIGGMLFGATFGVVQYFVGYENPYVVIALQSLKSVGAFLPMLLFGMFSADFVEYGHHATGRRLEGIVFSIQTFASKFTQAISAGLGGILLSWYGYTPNIEQNAETKEGIFVMFTLLPAVGAVLGALVMYRFYTLTETEVQSMIDQNQQNPGEPPDGS